MLKPNSEMERDAEQLNSTDDVRIQRNRVQRKRRDFGVSGDLELDAFCSFLFLLNIYRFPCGHFS